MPTTPAEDLLTAVADSLVKGDVEGLVEAWSRITVRADARAYQDILAILISKGYTKSQVDGWDALAEMRMSQGLYWSFTMGASLHGEDDKFVNKFDIREMLKKDDFNIAINGEQVNPAQDTDNDMILTAMLQTDDDRYLKDDEL